MSRGATVPQGREGLLTALDLRLDPRLLDRALTHRSYAYENGNLPTNERLEFLGDAVLQLVVTDALYRRHPDLAEGALAKQRASVVNMRALAAVARDIGPAGIGPYLLLGKGEETTGGRDKPSILADTLEALIGAVYLELGLEVASEFVHRHFDPLLDEAAGRGAGLDWKTSLQERTAELGMGPPDYVVTDSGPDHAKRFRARARISDRIYGEGEGGSKKEAEQRAAEHAFVALQGLAPATSVAAATADASGLPGDGGPAGPSPTPPEAGLTDPLARMASAEAAAPAPAGEPG
ncbi:MULTISPECIES: ribonuclease III [unclassified Pseudofrankia]|uniref:ribonuclease III n=1 Tax=unclassified Pseudofrankia TaxID=2994372 RepID=UPI0008DA1928|nr:MULTISPECIES: ribonuclease III [unclassified Pseudofrankia]MDT3443776.1 ribonuclease III [Pseudofrankia sp. BMG5.37]OHV50008.1 ribonuclease III [Pseudofrankia sp. BMG5.36]